MKVLIWVLTGICLIFILVLLCWYFWNTVLEDIGLGEGRLIIDTKQDALQICIILAAIGAGIIVSYYTYFTYLQVKALQNQVKLQRNQVKLQRNQITLQQTPSLRIELEQYCNFALSFSTYDDAIKDLDKFEETTEGCKNLIINYKVINASKYLADYLLDISTYILKDVTISKDLYRFDFDTQNNDKYVVEKNSLNGKVVRTIQSGETINDYFRLDLVESLKYLYDYMNTKSDNKYAFWKENVEVNSGNILNTLVQYTDFKSEKSVIDPDPFWIKFSIISCNPNYKKDTEIRQDLLYYFKIYKKTKGNLYIDFVRDPKKY